MADFVIRIPPDPVEYQRLVEAVRSLAHVKLDPTCGPQLAVREVEVMASAADNLGEGWSMAMVLLDAFSAVCAGIPAAVAHLEKRELVEEDRQRQAHLMIDRVLDLVRDASRAGARPDDSDV
jgi:hypothetical protein